MLKEIVLASIPEKPQETRNTRNLCTRPIHILKYILLLFLEREREEEREEKERVRERSEV